MRLIKKHKAVIFEDQHLEKKQSSIMTIVITIECTDINSVYEVKVCYPWGRNSSQSGKGQIFEFPIGQKQQLVVFHCHNKIVEMRKQLIAKFCTVIISSRVLLRAMGLTQHSLFLGTLQMYSSRILGLI